MGEDKVGRVIITYDYADQQSVSLRLQNLPPILALGLLTLASERLKREVLAGGISPVIVPKIRLPRV